MGLTPGTRIGVYEIISLLGAGGMGEVYGARDTDLKREIAIKVLPASFAGDAERLARFQREAEVLAALNHPNIAHIHGLEKFDGTIALVMELVEGPTLADRIAEGAVPLDEALPIAKQIAEALEAAHEQGIIHRDLKPANIKVRSDGTVKVLDFGLAKALEPAPTTGMAGALANSPTITSPAHMTGVGVLLGTAAYMSPEQAKGRSVDKRTDVWAFGAVLYEMLAGQPLFPGEDVVDTIAAVVRQEIDWTALPASTPPSVRRLLLRCLNRDLNDRLRDIREARIAIGNFSMGAQRDGDMAIVSAAIRSPLWRRALPFALCAVVAAAITGAATRYGTVEPSSPRPVTRFSIVLPDGQTLPAPLIRHVTALSPDGEEVVYVANGRLYRRLMSELNAREIQGTDRYQDVSDPVFSPDGQLVAFYATGDRTLKTVAITGGVAETVAQIDAPYGISWDSDRIVFGQGNKGIMQVGVPGGVPTVLFDVNDDQEAQSPQLLPDGQHVLFTLASGTASRRWDQAQVIVQSLVSGERKTIVDGGSEARYVSTGHLLYARGDRVLAVAFDLQRLEVSGEPVTMLEGVWRSAGSATGASQFSVSPVGSLAYLLSPDSSANGSDPRSIAQVDRLGVVEPLNIPPGPWLAPRISPDGRRIAFATDDSKEGIVYTYELAGTSTMTRLTFNGNNRFPVWAGDSRHVVFQSDRGGDLALFSQSLDGPAERLTTPEPGEAHAPESWSAQADRLLFSVTKGSEVSLRTLSRDGMVVPYGDIHSMFPVGAVFSPDGRWIAYTATERGVSNVFVQPFPATGQKYQLIAEGTSNPHAVSWSPDGKELLYVPRFGGFDGVRFVTEPTVGFGNPIAIARPFLLTAPNSRTSYDVTPGGKFLALTMPARDTSRVRAPSAQVQIVQNWFEELKRLVPTN